MTSFLLFIFSLACMLIFCWGILKTERMVQIPFLSCSVFIGWVLPQLYGLASHNNLPSGALDKTIFMSTLCLVAMWLGYKTNKKKACIFNWQLNTSRLLTCAAILSLLGAFFFFKVSQLTEQANIETGGLWVGAITIYAFFANLLSYGMAIALILLVRKPNFIKFLVFLPGLLLYMERIFIKGRRAAMIELALMLIVALWFNRRILPPRGLILTIVFIGALVVNSIGDYRNIMLGENGGGWSGAGFSQIQKIDFVGNLERSFYGVGENYELTNAAMDIAATERELRFDFGVSIWNRFVHNYIPGQIFGNDFKESLRFDGGSSAKRAFGYFHYFGTSVTGMSDAFQSFWYFGAIKFFLIGIIMSRWYKSALDGSFSAQLVVMLSMSYALHAITHTTHHFFLNFFSLALFLVPVLWFSKIKGKHIGNRFIIINWIKN